MGQKELDLAHRSSVCCRDKIAEPEHHQRKRFRRHYPEGHKGNPLASGPSLVVTDAPNRIFVLHSIIRAVGVHLARELLLPDCFTREGVKCEELS